MKPYEIMALQRRVGTEDDGFWGRESVKALHLHLRRLMPKNNPWPNTDQQSLREFYGPPGEANLIRMEFPYPMFYGGVKVTSTRVHKKCADSLHRILTNIGRSFGTDKGVMEEAQDYGGVYYYRNKRGGKTLSLHAFGAAIDLDADDNTFRNHWPMKADMPLEIIEEFTKEGWLSAAAWWGYDAMHFQATR